MIFYYSNKMSGMYRKKTHNIFKYGSRDKTYPTVMGKYRIHKAIKFLVCGQFVQWKVILSTEQQFHKSF